MNYKRYYELCILILDRLKELDIRYDNQDFIFRHREYVMDDMLTLKWVYTKLSSMKNIMYYIIRKYSINKEDKLRFEEFFRDIYNYYLSEPAHLQDRMTTQQKIMCDIYVRYFYLNNQVNFLRNIVENFNVKIHLIRVFDKIKNLNNELIHLDSDQEFMFEGTEYVPEMAISRDILKNRLLVIEKECRSIYYRE